MKYKKLDYDPFYQYHPWWLKFLWFVSGFLLSVFFGFLLIKLSEFTNIEFPNNLFFTAIESMTCLGFGFVLNYYLMFGFFVRFGNNDPKFGIKLKNKKIKLDNVLFIKNVKKIVKEMKEAKKVKK
jgi:hypothetical protein